MKTKICYICKEDKPTILFYKNKTNKDGLNFMCMKCYKSKRYGPNNNTKR